MFSTFSVLMLEFAAVKPMWHRTARLTKIMSGMQLVDTCGMMMIHHTHSHADECVPGNLESSDLDDAENK
jgi:hypothetical protein